ncbi:uncharacterized protein BDV17DRAFT_284392 [Aspergillus undulatus]|uniref:uncharacterized protein n=1 Tax=Aspergillus undulatus TaxID=1810928 RepID=UPI003CCCC51F
MVTPYVLRAELSSPGIAESTCRVNGDPHDQEFLPTLPTGYTSLFGEINDRQAEPTVNNLQEQSPFFTSLPPEIRQLIYRHLFGDRRIHLDYDFVWSENRWVWWHRVCDDPENCPDKELTCPETADGEMTMRLMGWTSRLKKDVEYRVQAMSWLQCCKLGYQESLPVLYGSNTFVLTQGIDQLFRLSQATPQEHRSLFRSLSVEITVYRACVSRPPAMSAGFAEYYRGLFNLLERDLPSLRTLSLSLTSMPGPSNPPVEWTDEDDDRWIGPWERLGKSRRWATLEIRVPENWFEVFEERGRQRGKQYRKARYTLMKGLDPFQKGW